jgi:uncharacterized membrane protein YhdT
MAEANDDALSWGGESDPTHVDSDEPDAGAGADSAALAPGVSSPMLVVYGVFGGIYLLYTVGWLIAALQPSSATGVSLTDFMQQVSNILTVLAAPAWFIMTLVLTVSRRSRVRVFFLVVGVLVLLPWSFASGRIW